ncbi:protein kinase [Kytococcus sedentarius]|uniref:protein kinase domain-containing protein n=1 Tax=Kytococcus sedentarius TaxID=1276 RepID=UPI0035BC8026
MDARKLSDRYDVEEPLGHGGMADVVAATDTRLGRRVAVKILREDLARDPAFVRRFESEALAAARLNHPGIVSVFDVGEDQPDTRGGLPRPFIVMEKVAGSTLRTVLDTEGQLPPTRAVSIAADVLNALAYSHEQGVVHNDIKPGNIMITEDGSVKIMDFGIAQALNDMTITVAQPDHVLGTAKYMAPELAHGERAEPPSDVYALGCVLFEMLVGRPPFQGDSAALVNQHLHVAPPRVSSAAPSVPPALEELIDQALAKHPADRPGSAREMEISLRGLLGDLEGPRPSTTITGSTSGSGASSAWGAAGAAGAGGSSTFGGFRPLSVDGPAPTPETERPGGFRTLDEQPPRAHGAPTGRDDDPQDTERRPADETGPHETAPHGDSRPALSTGDDADPADGQAPVRRIDHREESTSAETTRVTATGSGSAAGRDDDPYAPWQPGDDVPSFAGDDPVPPAPPIGSETDVSGSTTGSLPADSDAIRMADTSRMRAAEHRTPDEGATADTRGEDGDDHTSRVAVAGAGATAAGATAAGAATADPRSTEASDSPPTRAVSTDTGTAISGTTRLGETGGNPTASDATGPVTGRFSRRARREGVPWWAWPLAGLALVGVAAGVAAGINNWADERGSVSVPDVRGKSQQEAEEILEEAGLEVRIEGRVDDAPLGTVLEQTPGPDTAVDHGSAVTLVVASTENSPAPSGSSDDPSSSEESPSESSEGESSSGASDSESSSGTGDDGPSSSEAPDPTTSAPGGVPVPTPSTSQAPPTDEGEPTTDPGPDPTTTQPDPTTTEPGPTTTEPGPTTTEPDPTTSEPDPTTTEPNPTTTEPDPTTSEPDPTTTEPDPTTSEPDPTTSEPDPTTSEPDPTTTEPDPTTSEPDPTTTEPDPTTSEPDPTTSEPDPTTSEPDPTTAEPTTSEPDPTTSDPDPSEGFVAPSPTTAEPTPSDDPSEPSSSETPPEPTSRPGK